MTHVIDLHGSKVLSGIEMSRIERLSLQDGASELDYVLQAGQGIAKFSQDFLISQKLIPSILILVGKGNNGADSLAAAEVLLGLGFEVTIACFFQKPICSPLNQLLQKRLQDKGSNLNYIENINSLDLPNSYNCILDGLLGIGFKGPLDNILNQVIEWVNLQKKPVLAIDIPSGLDSNTGTVMPIAIKATHTLYLGAPKLGFFINQGWEHVGQISYIDFGLPTRYLDNANPSFYLINIKALQKYLEPPQRTQHKYSRGYVVAYAGSESMPGAGALASLAALRTGAGIVRVFTQNPSIATHYPNEVIVSSIEDSSLLTKECKRSRALLIGPGIGKPSSYLDYFFSFENKPKVIDADALLPFVSSHVPSNSPTILTPHKAELARCLKAEQPTEEFLIHGAQELAERKNCVVLLKGAPSWIFSPSYAPLIMTFGDPGMATAGAGDVLSGMLAALLARGLSAEVASVIGATLHGLAGELSAEKQGSISVIASDLIEEIPKAYLKLSTL